MIPGPQRSGETSAQFAGPVDDRLASGDLVLVWDGETPGTVVSVLDDRRYEVSFPSIGRPCRYPASQVRPWPAQIAVRS